MPNSTIKAQITKPGSTQLQYGNTNDSAEKKTNTSEWDENNAQISYNAAFSKQKHYLDSSIHQFHRRPYSQDWYRDLGNLGSPSYSYRFQIHDEIGRSWGYHSFDALRLKVEDLNYFETNRPYSEFTYNLGSKLEQQAQIFHTQNIKPYWNMAIQYRKINSPGYYITQRNNHDQFSWTQQYKSPSEHYQVYTAVAYNKLQHDENGGILADSFLTNASFSDRKSIPALFYNANYSTVRSAVTTLQRDVHLLFQQAYTWGKTDTLYNKDSSRYTTQLKGRFRLSHRLEMASQRYQYKDLRPDSSRYAAFFAQSFGTGDSVYMRQERNFIDNRFLINGILGNPAHPFLFNAGAGIRCDALKTAYTKGQAATPYWSNYLSAQLSKEALQAKQWALQAQAILYVTGVAAGNFDLKAAISKDLGLKWGTVSIALHQNLRNASYHFTDYQNRYWQRSLSFNKESNTSVQLNYNNEMYHLKTFFKQYLINQYLYFDAQQIPTQASSAFTLSQWSLRKMFVLGPLTFDNEILFQQVANTAPINIPNFVCRSQLALEKAIFKKKLQIATGLEAFYHSAFYSPAYSPIFNQFYFQNTYRLTNPPMMSVFFNFKLKRFKAYFMIDQLQQAALGQTMIATRGYALQNTMLRFGFNWTLIN